MYVPYHFLLPTDAGLLSATSISLRSEGNRRANPRPWGIAHGDWTSCLFWSWRRRAARRPSRRTARVWTPADQN